MFSHARRYVFFLSFLILNGCGTITHRNAIQSNSDNDYQDVGKHLVQTREWDKQRGALVREINGIWLGEKTIKVSRDAELPAIFSQSIAFQFPDRPSINVLADRIGKITGMTTRVTPDALVPIESLAAQSMNSVGNMANSSPFQNGGRPIGVTPPPAAGPIGQYAPSMMNGSFQLPPATRPLIIDLVNPFNGTLSNLLDQISAKYGVGWDYKDGVILISRFVTRTYQISAITDINDLSAGISKAAQAGGGGSSSQGGTTGSASSTSDVSSKITATIDIIKGLEEAIKGTLTPGVGKYAISSSGIVTVTDTREVQEQVRELIAAENKAIGRQVKLRVQIIQVEATQDDDTGVDWSWLIDRASAKWNVDFKAATMPGEATGLGQLGVIRNGKNSTTKFFLKALSEVGKVDIRKDETYMTLNNRLLSIANTENYIYPARSTPVSSVTNQATASPGIEPGQLTTGTFLNLRSSIQPNGSVIVQFSLDASMRERVTTLESNGVKLQYPQASSNQYQIYASVVSGETAVLAGIENTQQQSTDRSLDGKLTPLLGGGISASTHRRAILVLLTPTIVEGVN